MKNVTKLLALLVALIMASSVLAGVSAASPEGVIYYDTFDSEANGYASSVNAVIIPGDKDTVIEYRAKSLTESAVSGGVKITCDDVDEFEISSDTYTSDWAVYNVFVSSANSAASYYKDGTLVKTVEFSDITLADTVSVAVDFISNGNIAFDYAAVYEKPALFSVTAESYADGILEISANMPVSAALSSVSLGGGSGVFAKKEGSAFEYTAEFDSSAVTDGENTASFTLYGIDGVLLDEAEITFSAKAYVMPEYSRPAPYIFDNFSSASELEHYSFNTENGVCTPSVDEAAGQMLISSSAANGISKYPSIFYNGTIPNTSNFVLEFKVDNLGGYCAFSISIGQDGSNAADLFRIVRNDAIGAFKIYFDFSGGNAYLYKNDTLMNTKNLANKSVTQIKITAQNYGSSVSKIDYIYAYPVADEFSMKAEKVNVNSMLLRTTEPIDTAASSFSVNNAAASVSAVSGEYCTYNITFGEPLEYSSSYILTSTVAALSGAQLIKNYGFAFETGAYVMPEYSRPAPYIFDNFSSASELEHYSFTTENGVCTPSVDEAAGQMLISSSAANGTSKYPSILYNGTIPNTSNFVLEFKVDNLGSYCAFNISIGQDGAAAAGLFGITRAKAIGAFKIYFDFSGGKAYLYKNDSLMDTKDLANKSVTQIKITAQNYGSSVSKIDYIYAYPVADEFSMKTESPSVRDMILKTTEPIDTSASSFSVNGVAASAAAVSGEYGTYKIIFGEKLLYASDYTLVSNITALKGTVAVKNYETAFATPEYVAPEYSAPQELLFENFEDGKFSEDAFNVSDSSTQKMELVGGKLRVVGITEKYPRLNVRSIPADADNIIIEYNMSSVGYNNTIRFGLIASSKDALSSYTQTNDFTDTRYVLYNPVKGIYEEYNGNFEKIGENTEVSKNPSSFDIRYYMFSNKFAAKYFEWDYVAVYKQAEDFTMKLENVTAEGAVLKTSLPMDINTTQLKIGNTAVTAVKNANSYNTYTLSFAEPLEYRTDYVLSGSANYLGGAQSVSVSESFNTGEPPYEYSGLTAAAVSGGIQAQITVTNNTESDKVFVLAAAVYDGGELKGIKITPVTAQAGVKDAVLTSETVSVQAENPVYRVFA